MKVSAGQSGSGTFPFGMPSGRCEPRRVKAASAVVLGVYASALHIRWTHPRHRIAALAVAPEPWPFWDGRDETELIDRWREEVGWRPEWGSAEPVGRLNGSSGRVVHDRILCPLGLDPDQVWMSDVLPFFHVHRGRGTQGRAMSERYDVFAGDHALPLHQLPDRPPVDQLVRQAIQEEGERIIGELVESEATLLITLGNEALAVLSALLTVDLPGQLSQSGDYGKRYRTKVAGQTVEVLPLVHPGQRAPGWVQAHERWMRTLSV